jgi:hypothetical protein
LRRSNKKKIWRIDPKRKGRGKVWVWVPPQKSLADKIRDGDDIMLSEEQFLEILAANADAVCYRCKVRLKDHRGSDHVFFEQPDEAPDEESN